MTLIKVSSLPILQIKRALLLVSTICIIPFLASDYAFRRFLNHHEVCFVEPRSLAQENIGGPSLMISVPSVRGAPTNTGIAKTNVPIDASLCRVEGPRRTWICSSTSCRTSRKSSDSNTQENTLHPSWLTQPSCRDGIDFESAIASDAQFWSWMNHKRNDGFSALIDKWRLEHDTVSNEWCFTSLIRDGRWCGVLSSRTGGSRESEGVGDVPKVPPSGIWTLRDITTTQYTTKIAVQCYSKRYTSRSKASAWTSWNPFKSNISDTYKIENVRHNPNAKTSGNTPQVITEFLDHPTTHFLILLLCIIYLVYQHYGTSPSSVAKSYYSIVTAPTYEIWRCFTGATAHFEPFHLGMNCMALFSLGTRLEGPSQLYSSVEFLMYNISLIIWTGGVFILLIRFKLVIYRRYYRQLGRMDEFVNGGIEERIQLTSSVGYSGVLFAWMVVESLEQERTCPIPFLPSVCFQTHVLNFGNTGANGLKVNVGPFVQLVIAQAILPRVSFMGHLSGILCGFFFHWRILHPEIFLSPQVLVPLILIVHWRIVSRHQGTTNSIRSFSLENDWVDEENEDASNRDTRKIYIYHLLWKAQLFLSLISFITLSWCSSLVFAQVMVTSMYHFTFQNFKKIDTNAPTLRNTEQATTLLKGAFLCFLLQLVSDFVVLPRWLILRYYIQAEQQEGALEATVLLCIMLLRFAINGFTFLSLCGELHDIQQAGGAFFQNTFGWIINTAVGLIAASTSKSSGVIPFQGHGFTLGR